MGKFLKVLEKAKAQKKTDVPQKAIESQNDFSQMDVGAIDHPKRKQTAEAKKKGSTQKPAGRKGQESGNRANKNTRTVFLRPPAQDTDYTFDYRRPYDPVLDGDPGAGQKEVQHLKECIIDKDEIAAKLLEMRMECSRQTFENTSAPKHYNTHKKVRAGLIALHRPNSIISEQFKVARALVSKVVKEKDIRTILVTSALPLEGKSFVASNLAVSMARGLDEHVLLVDADLTSPSLQDIFQIKSSKGLSDFLVCGDYELSSFIKKTKVPKLSLLPAGSFFERSSELLASELMRLFIQEAKYRYDDRFIIFDSSPLIVSQSLALCDKVDGVIIVVKASKTDRKLVEKTVEMIGRQKVVGIIMNYCNVSSWKYAGYIGKESSDRGDRID
jgi:protein-tyrosine kinase